MDQRTSRPSQGDDATRMSSASSPSCSDRKRSSFSTSALVPERFGTEISSRYDIRKEEIGTGGYGKVYVATDRQFADRAVAIKKVIVMDQNKKAAFAKEVKIMKELDHPNICKLYETYEQNRFMFFVMEYLSGREVFDRIMDLGQISESVAASIIRQCASALKYAHSKGIAHRDMKPENIVFCSEDPDDDQIKVIDWGLGFYFGQARMSSAVGSMAYAAPEVLDSGGRKGTTYTSSCDIWSIGVLAYVMLCGSPPFWGNVGEQLRRMKNEQYPMKDSNPTWKEISKEAKDFIRGVLKANPLKRMTVDSVLEHPWLKRTHAATDPEISKEVLINMRRFSNTSHFFSVCVASVARQLDHKQLKSVHKVFCEMDTNGDGVLELHEVKTGFEKIFGKDSCEVRDVVDMFQKLDLDNSGTIDYTEFCAAGIGEKMSLQESTLWSAFCSFDVQDADGRITADEIKQVLQSADVHKAWSPDVCQQVAKEIVTEFDQDGDGTIDFGEFVKVMRAIAQRQTNEAISYSSESDAIKSLQAASAIGGWEGFDKAYGTLDQSRNARSPTREVSQSLSRRFADQCGCGGGVMAVASPKNGQNPGCSIS